MKGPKGNDLVAVNVHCGGALVQLWRPPRWLGAGYLVSAPAPVSARCQRFLGRKSGLDKTASDAREA